MNVITNGQNHPKRNKIIHISQNLKTKSGSREITTESVKQLTKKFYLEALYFVGILLEDSWGLLRGLI